jgi:hypothetical protein
MKRAVLLVTMLFVASSDVAGQGRDAAREDYFRAVAAFFSLPATEIAILSDWDIPPDEIPVVLFLAQRAGVSPEALVALRISGQSWSTLSDRYRVTASTLHVPVRDEAPAGTLAVVYERYRRTAVGEWNTISLTDADVIGLVNVRLIAQSLGVPAEEVLRRTGLAASFVELYAQLKR